jgi:hypothetical protein
MTDAAVMTTGASVDATDAGVNTTDVLVQGIGAPVVLTGAGVIAAGASVASTDPDVDVAEDALVGDRALRQVVRLGARLPCSSTSSARRASYSFSRADTSSARRARTNVLVLVGILVRRARASWACSCFVRDP